MVIVDNLLLKRTLIFRIMHFRVSLASFLFIVILPLGTRITHTFFGLLISDYLFVALIILL